MERRNLTKKRNFSEPEIETLTTQVGNHSLVLFGSLKSGIKGGQKKAVWKKITDVVNSVGIESRTPAEVKKKWSDLKLATKKRVAVLKRGRPARLQPCSDADRRTHSCDHRLGFCLWDKWRRRHRRISFRAG